MLSDKQNQMVALWESHTRYEFLEKNVEATLSTMSNKDHDHLLNIPTAEGGVGQNAIRYFYANKFITYMPPDIQSTLISRTVSDMQIVDETILSFTHTVEMPWILPGIAPTGKKVEIPLVVIVRFLHDKITHEHVYWDQGSVLVQVGLIDPQHLPVTGTDSAIKLRNYSALNPS